MPNKKPLKTWNRSFIGEFITINNPTWIVFMIHASWWTSWWKSWFHMIQKAIDLGVSNLHPPGASGPKDQPSRSTMRIWTNHPRSAVEVTDCDFVDTSGPLPFPSPKARVFSDSRTARRNKWFNAMVPVTYTYVYIFFTRLHLSTTNCKSAYLLYCLCICTMYTCSSVSLYPSPSMTKYNHPLPRH